jgi:putative RecB family exonuclease
VVGVELVAASAAGDMMTHTTMTTSPSSVLLFGNCRRAFQFRKVLRLSETAETDSPLGLGRSVHTGAEDAVREHLAAERSGPLSVTTAVAGFQRQWFAEGMSDPSLYAEGLAMVENLVADQGVLDHRDVLAVEKQFEVPIGRHRLRGIFDRVDAVDRRTIRVIDYKSNQRLFTADELQKHLQLSLYEHAARILWPWAERVELQLWMLRFRLQQRTSRTPDQVRAAVSLAEATCDAILRETEFAPTLSSSCGYCGYRQHCSAYADAVAGNGIPGAADVNDVEGLAAEREKLVTIAGLIEKRRKKIDGIIMKRLKDQRSILTPTIEYTTYNTKSYEYPVADTLDELAQAAGWTREQIAERIIKVDNGALKDLVQEVGIEKGAAHAALVEANLQALADVTQTPRLWAKRLSR